MHNAAFDLRVVDVLLRPELDVYAAVEAGLVWDTLILKRLLTLATAGHTARGEAGLAACAAAHLGVDLDKAGRDARGELVRVNFGRFLGKPPAQIPDAYLRYLAADAVATWHLFWTLHTLVKETLQKARGVYGYVDDAWLKDAIRRFGPLTHHVQLKASIVTDELRANGIGLDRARSGEKARKLKELLERCKERMRSRGYLAGEKGGDKAMQAIRS